MKYVVTVSEDDRVDTVKVDVGINPPLNKMVDQIQMALLEAGFSYDAEVVNMKIEWEEGDAEE